MAGKRCQREGCRAWAQRGWSHCAAHIRQAVRERERRFPVENGAEPTPAGVEWVRGQWTVQELRMLEKLARQLASGEAEGLAGEIAAARVTLARLLREEDDAVRLADGVAKAANVVFKARQIERQMSDATSEGLLGVADRILGELEFGQQTSRQQAVGSEQAVLPAACWRGGGNHERG